MAQKIIEAPALVCLGQFLKIVYVSPDEIRPNPKNPRKRSRRQMRAVANSIAIFGMNAPILADAKGNIIVGHCRWDAATGHPKKESAYIQQRASAVMKFGRGRASARPRD